MGALVAQYVRAWLPAFVLLEWLYCRVFALYGRFYMFGGTLYHDCKKSLYGQNKRFFKIAWFRCL